MKKRLSKRVLTMLHDTWRYFPELHDRNITVGYSAKHLGSAIVPLGAKGGGNLTIRLKVKDLTYQTIGHELTHLVQGLAKIRSGRRNIGEIPSGEKQCDIWTLARSRLFCDDAPTYLRLPRAVRENWPLYAESVRRLCVAALNKRKTYRFYISWLESRLKDLAGKPVSEKQETDQLLLPF